MKTNPGHRQTARAAAGFTLPEVLIASGLLVLLTTAIVSTFIFGLQLYQTTEVKLGANDQARKAVLTVTDDIRSATKIKVGTGGLGNFTEIMTNALTGPVIQIYPTSDTNTWIRYYGENDPGSTNYGRLCRVGSADGTNFSVVVPHSVLNPQTLFSSEDSYGNVLSNNLNNRIIGLNLQLYTVENTTAQIGGTVSHDYYQLRTRITRRRL